MLNILYGYHVLNKQKKISNHIFSFIPCIYHLLNCSFSSVKFKQSLFLEPGKKGTSFPTLVKELFSQRENFDKEVVFDRLIEFILFLSFPIKCWSLETLRRHSILSIQLIRINYQEKLIKTIFLTLLVRFWWDING